MKHSPVPFDNYSTRTLQERLKEWTDFDGAAYHLGVLLGLWKDSPAFGRTKWVFWSHNPLGNFLNETLVQMCELGILLGGENQFKWNELYKWDESSPSSDQEKLPNQS